MSEEEKDVECPRHNSHFITCQCGTIHEAYKMYPLKGKWSLEEWERDQRKINVRTFTPHGNITCKCGFKYIPKLYY